MVCVIFVNTPLLYLSQISFVRQRDFRLLSNGHSLFTTDRRFEIVHRAKTIDWILRLKRVQLSDSGAYMCQVSGMWYGNCTNWLSINQFQAIISPQSYEQISNLRQSIRLPSLVVNII